MGIKLVLKLYNEKRDWSDPEIRIGNRTSLNPEIRIGDRTGLARNKDWG